MSEEFVGEPITPVIATGDCMAMARGAPGVPAKFLWRRRTYCVTEIIKQDRKLGACTHKSGEMYVRRHQYWILTDTGERMRIYCDRGSPRGKPSESRWWIFSWEPAAGK